VNDDELIVPHVGMLRRVAVELGCLACGADERRVLTGLSELPRLPLPCPRCLGGRMVAGAIGTIWVSDSSFRIDMSDPDRRPRGRPPGARNRPKAAAA